MKSALQREKSKSKAGGTHEEFEILKDAVKRERSSRAVIEDKCRQLAVELDQTREQLKKYTDDVDKIV